MYEEVLKARDNVRKGGTISEVFKESPVIPSTLSQMVAAGESSGNLDRVLMSLAKFYNTEVDTTVENLMSLLEPILMVGLDQALDSSLQQCFTNVLAFQDQCR